MLVLVAALAFLYASATSEAPRSLRADQIAAEEITVMDILRKAQPRIAAHWAFHYESRPELFTRERTARIDGALVAYFEELKLGMPREEILSAMARLFARLDAINKEVDGLILETDERELLVPIILDGAVAAGLNLADFPDGDPTLEYRTF